MNVPSKFTEAGQALGKSLSKVRKKELDLVLSRIDSDVILTHDDNNSSLNNYLASEAKKPCVVFNHSALAVAGGISVFSIIESMHKLSEAGHTTVFVSEGVRSEWFDQMQKSAKWLPGVPLDDAKKTINEIHLCPVMWEERTNQVEATKGFCMIGRPIKEKKLLLGAEVSQEMTIFTTPAKNEDETAYVDSILEKCKDVRVGIPHADILDEVRNMKGLICASDEAASLVAFEANSQGVPVILYHKRADHPLTEICNPGKEFNSFVHINSKSIDKKQFQAYLMNFQSNDLETRKAISQKTWEYYNPQKSYDRLLDLINRSVVKFNTTAKEESSLDGFFE